MFGRERTVHNIEAAEKRLRALYQEIKKQNTENPLFVTFLVAGSDSSTCEFFSGLLEPNPHIQVDMFHIVSVA